MQSELNHEQEHNKSQKKPLHNRLDKINELEKIDFTKINFGKLFRDFEEKSRLSIESKKTVIKKQYSQF